MLMSRGCFSKGVLQDGNEGLMVQEQAKRERRSVRQKFKAVEADRKPTETVGIVILLLPPYAPPSTQHTHRLCVQLCPQTKTFAVCSCLWTCLAGVPSHNHNLHLSFILSQLCLTKLQPAKAWTCSSMLQSLLMQDTWSAEYVVIRAQSLKVHEAAAPEW